MSNYQLRCPVCETPVRQNHHCHGRTPVRYVPLEGEAALEAVRRVKEELQRVKNPPPPEPLQTRINFESEGL